MGSIDPNDDRFDFAVANIDTATLRFNTSNDVDFIDDTDSEFNGTLYINESTATINALWTNAGYVTLNQGTLAGGSLINQWRLLGHGTVSTRVINDGTIRSEGGTLIVDHVLNDWEGMGNAGLLHGQSGVLELRDNSTVSFEGTVQVDEGATVSANGFGLQFEAGSTLDLRGGTYSSTATTNFHGTVGVTYASSALELGYYVFRNGSTTTLDEDLVLNAGGARIDQGATFAGGGALVNSPARVLSLQDGAHIGALLENQGVLAYFSPGQTTGTDFQQTVSGQWLVEIMGTGLNDYDRMNLTGAARLAGTLNLSLQTPYVPTLGDTLDILSANGGLGGTTFDTVLQPAGMPAGLVFEVNYLTTIVQLKVVDLPMFTADFDQDGDVDAADLAQWEGDYGLNGDSDADSDGRDFLAWQQQAGSGLPVVPAADAVPEPGSIGLLLLGVTVMAVGPLRVHS